jgi:hypothetical protein
LSKVIRATVLVCLALLLIASLASAQTSQSPLEKLPYSSSLLMARAIQAGRIHLPSVEEIPNITDLTCSPAPCVLPTSQASPGAAPANTTPIVVNPKNPSVLLAGANDYSCAFPNGNMQGYYLSTDAGTTWNHTCMSVYSGLGQGDPGVAFSANGKFAYIAGLQANRSGTNGVVFERSSDNGTTWSAAHIAVYSLFGCSAGACGAADKPQLQIDTNASSPYVNCLYISTTQWDDSKNSTIAVAHSCDGGGTWTNSVQVDTLQTHPFVDQFSDLAIGKDGTVYVTWLNCPTTGAAGDCGGTASTIRFSKSTDGGNTWSTPSNIAGIRLVADSCSCAFYGSLPNTSEPVSNIPAIGIDNSDGPNAGNLYVVYYSYAATHAQMRVLVSTSSDGGTSWSTGMPVVPANVPNDEFFPWLTVSRNGGVGVTWLDRRNDPSNISYQAFAALSQNGVFFGPDQELTSTLSNPNNDGFGGTFMGDYTGNFFTGNTLYASWPDTSNGVNAQDVVGGFVQ